MLTPLTAPELNLKGFDKSSESFENLSSSIGVDKDISVKVALHIRTSHTNKAVVFSDNEDKFIHHIPMCVERENFPKGVVYSTLLYDLCLSACASYVQGSVFDVPKDKMPELITNTIIFPTGIYTEESEGSKTYYVTMCLVVADTEIQKPDFALFPSLKFRDIFLLCPKDQMNSDLLGDLVYTYCKTSEGDENNE